MTRPDHISNMEIRIAEIKERKDKAVETQLFEEATRLRDEEKQAKAELQNMLETWRNSYETNYVPVTDEDVMSVLAKWTGIPLARMEEKETTKLLRMEEELKSKVIGQDEAASAIAALCGAAVRISRIRAARSAHSSSWAPPAWAKPIWPAIWRKSCSAPRTP